MFSRSGLAFTKWRAMRRVRAKVLIKVEQIVLDLTTKCVERVHSFKLTGIAVTIGDKLTYSVKSRIKRLNEDVGCLLARKLSRIAENEDSICATRWAENAYKLKKREPNVEK